MLLFLTQSSNLSCPHSRPRIGYSENLCQILQITLEEIVLCVLIRVIRAPNNIKWRPSCHHLKHQHSKSPPVNTETFEKEILKPYITHSAFLSQQFEIHFITEWKSKYNEKVNSKCIITIMGGTEDYRNISLINKVRYLEYNFQNKLKEMKHKFLFQNMSIISDHWPVSNILF